MFDPSQEEPSTLGNKFRLYLQTPPPHQSRTIILLCEGDAEVLSEFSF